MRATLIVVALAVAVSAIPQDAAVPEAMDSVHIPEAAHKEAQSIVDTIFAQQGGGKGADACKSLAKSAKDEVTAATKTAQELLNKINDGAKCKDAGQSAVTSAKNAKAQAHEASKSATDAYAAALDTKLSWTDISFSSLTEGNCNTFYSSQQWQSAKAKVAAAKKTKDEAAGALKSAIQLVADAVIAAVQLAGKCACKAQTDAKAATAASNKNLVTTNTKAWTKAAHLLCVLAGTNANNCVVSQIPQVGEPKMAEGVAKMCNGQTSTHSKGLLRSNLMKEGWTQCWNHVYSNSQPDAAKNLYNKCKGKYILEGCGTAGSDTLKVSARGLKTDVFNKNCKTKQIPGGGVGEYHVADGIGWFCNDMTGTTQYSHVGFILAKDVNNVKLNQCAGTPSGMCIHTSNGALKGGYSCDGDTGANNHEAWWFYKN